MLDGTYKERPNGPGTGRIKFGTESNGGFKNITISNCVFDYCCGLALESVDGADLEDVAISNLTMRDISSAPIYLRLGGRLRGPEGTKVGHLRRVTISNVIVHNAPTSQGVLIAGIPGHDIEDVVLDDIRIDYPGGGTPEMAAIRPDEKVTAYPEPASHGPTPGYGLYARHVNGLTLHDLHFATATDDARPPVYLDAVTDADVSDLAASRGGADVPTFRLKDVQDFTACHVKGVPDTHKDKAEDEKL
jgi:polygalacturonase